MIHYIQPYRSDKNIGKAINYAIEQLKADDNAWICLMDHDILWLRPDSKKQLEEILHTTDYDILGPVTNRLGIDYQLVNGMFNKTDIHDHIECANVFHEQHYGQVKQTTNILAAFCLCFRVSTWQKLGKFRENSIQLDSIFCATALNKGLKLGIMVGIYVFHLYRMGKDITDYSHLLPSVSQDSARQ